MNALAPDSRLAVAFFSLFRCVCVSVYVWSEDDLRELLGFYFLLSVLWVLGPLRSPGLVAIPLPHGAILLTPPLFMEVVLVCFRGAH